MTPRLLNYSGRLIVVMHREVAHVEYLSRARDFLSHLQSLELRVNLLGFRVRMH